MSWGRLGAFDATNTISNICSHMPRTEPTNTQAASPICGRRPRPTVPGTGGSPSPPGQRHDDTVVLPAPVSPDGLHLDRGLDHVMPRRRDPAQQEGVHVRSGYSGSHPRRPRSLPRWWVRGVRPRIDTRYRNPSPTYDLLGYVGCPSAYAISEAGTAHTGSPAGTSRTSLVARMPWPSVELRSPRL